MSNIRRIIKRLSVLGPAEVLHRIIEQWLVMTLHARFRLGVLARKYESMDSTKYAFTSSPQRQLPELPLAIDLTTDEKANLLAGQWPALGFAWQWSDSPDCWSRAPDTGNTWPTTAFFDRINYRANNPYGDVRVAWEPSRLQQLIALAALANENDDIRHDALDLIGRLVESWLAANPPARGIHYISVMECALRILSVTHALDMVRPHVVDNEPLWNAAARLVKSHADLIETRLSLYSSIGNHTTAECVGLVYAGTLFPEFPHARRWLDKGLSVLRREAEHQVLPDGAGVEGSPWYHALVLDLLGLTEQLLLHHDQPVPREISRAVARGRTFLSRLADGPRGLVRLNDADDGYALSRYLRLSWLDTAPPGPVLTFPDAGITRVALADDRESFLIMDHGPLGMPPIFAHAHADALAVILRIRGQDLTVDPGTYMYTGGPAWRRYFRSTSAHNTLCVDGLDQASQATPFQWSRPFSASLERSEIDEAGVVKLLARHDGYSGSAILHWRGVIAVRGQFVMIHDIVRGNGTHCVDLHWHLASDPQTTDDAFLFPEADGVITLSVTGGITSLHRGETDPLIGWRSAIYGEKHPITTIKIRHEGPLPHEMSTLIQYGDSAASDRQIEGYRAEIRSWLMP